MCITFYSFVFSLIFFIQLCFLLLFVCTTLFFSVLCLYDCSPIYCHNLSNNLQAIIVANKLKFDEAIGLVCCTSHCNLALILLLFSSSSHHCSFPPIQWPINLFILSTKFLLPFNLLILKRLMCVMLHPLLCNKSPH